MQSRKKNKKRGPPPYLAPRDTKILRYLWRWKISSTASIHEAICRPDSEYSTYKVLVKLERNGMIESRINLTERFHVWQLTKSGFHEVRSVLGDLAEEGYLSENDRHDRLVQAFQLGEWATHQNPDVDFFTEQEMRRNHADDYPEWVPKTKEHRPDGYTRITGPDRSQTIAYEVELSAKALQRYEGPLRFYRGARVVDRVIWLVGSAAIQEAILKTKIRIHDESTNYHLFVDLRDFLKFGWDAPVINERSEILFTLRENYREICGGIFGEILESCRDQLKTAVHLENRKVIGKSKR